MRLSATLAAALALGAFGCQAKAPADAEQPTAEKPAAEKPTDKAAEKPAEKPAEPMKPAEGEEKAAGIYPVRQTDADANALVPNEGDHVVNVKDAEGTWYMLGVRERIPLTHIATVERDAPRGGVHFDLAFDAAGTEKLKALTTAENGKKVAFVVDGVVIMAPVVREPISGGKLMVSCGAPDAACVDAMTAFYDAHPGKREKPPEPAPE